MKIFKRVVAIVLIIISLICIYLIGTGYSIYRQALKEQSLEQKVNEIREKYDYTKINEIPDIYKKAVIAVEDHRFYKHKGVDPISIGRAIIRDISAMSFVEGGSTLTQQLCKNIYFTQEKKLTRKIAEVFMAWNLEKHYEKDEILEMYINTAYYGSGYYGIKQAARGYFGKEPNEMNEYECTILAGVPNAPSVYALNNKNGLAEQRQKQVLNSMVAINYISQEKSNEILSMEEAK